jgi:transposase
MGRPPVIPVDDKQRIVLSVVSGEMTVAEAARRNKVSEQSIFRWKQQFLDAGRTGLVDGGRVSTENPWERMLLAEIEGLKAALGEAPRAVAGVEEERRASGGPFCDLEVIRIEIGCLDREVLPADRGTRADLAALAGPRPRRWLTQGSVADSGAGCGGGRGGREGEGLAGLGGTGR